MGLVEVLSLGGSRPAEPGELGTMVVTPFFPYRDCMPVFRYDTRDLVRRLPDGRLTCNLAGVPALSPILGKADQLVSASGRLVTPRDIVEVLEMLPGAPWPSQYRAAGADGRLRLTVTPSTLSGASAAVVEARFAELGIDCIVDTADIDVPLRPVRADLVETTFTAGFAAAGLATTGA
jgi:phenylacetate-coenzyme A ligase PaaK-like adenylate-forming protein